MQHYRSLHDISLKNSWLTVGVFDGVHRGHQAIIKQLTDGAHALGLSACLLTFDPHPAIVLGRGDIRLLTLPEERAELLGALGVDVVITHPFDREVANMTASDFMRRLKTHLGVTHLILGYDSTLGRNREGNAARLTEIGEELGYTLETVAALGDESGVFSSTAIRKLIATGNVRESARLMGRPYCFRGVVIHGDHRGRELGYPTANLSHAPGKLIPANGIYACRARLGEERFMAAVNVGVRPTVKHDQSIPNVEAYLLDFDRNIYGEVLALEFVERLRDEIKFESLNELVAQIGRDVEQTRERFAEE